jgi:hypothetical protein
MATTRLFTGYTTPISPMTGTPSYSSSGKDTSAARIRPTSRRYSQIYSRRLMIHPKTSYRLGST